MVEKFKSFITETKEEKYKLLILSHDDLHDPNETGALIRKKAHKLGLEVYLAEFSGMYMEPKGNDHLIYSFPVDEKGQASFPSMSEPVDYDEPFKINPSNTLIMARGLGSSVKTGNRSWQVAIQNLEDQGYAVINSTKCNDICNDKWYNQVIFQQNNFKTPNTVLVRHSEGAEIAAEKINNKFPMILKTSVGSRGVGVMWIESLKSLHSIVQLLYRENSFVDIILQEYIKTDFDVRVIIVGNKILGAIKRPIVHEDFRSNVSQGSEPEPVELTEIESKESLRAAKVVDGTIVGVDFIPAKNREKDSPYFLEVNSTPGLIGIESVLSKSSPKPHEKNMPGIVIKDAGKSITTQILKMFMDRSIWKRSPNICGVFETFEHDVFGKIVGEMDTGNSSPQSVIHADSYEINNKKITMSFDGKKITTPMFGKYTVSTGAGEEERPIIKLDLLFNNILYKSFPLTIDDRTGRSPKLLINRGFLNQANLLVNPSRKFILSEEP